MRGKRKGIQYRAGIPQPLGVPATAERLAVAAGMATVHRELTKDEGLIVLAVAQMFAEEIAALDAQIDELRRQVYELTDRLIDLTRMSG